MINCHLFHFAVLLNPAFNCSKRFLSFSFDKVTTGTQFWFCWFKCCRCCQNIYCWFYIWNICCIQFISSNNIFSYIAYVTQFLDRIKISSISQIINGIFNDLQKLFKSFNGTTNLTLSLFAWLSLLISRNSPIMLDLKSKEIRLK